MKSILILVILTFSFNSNAGFWSEVKNSFYFEPTLLCVAGAAGGYTVGNENDRNTTMAIGCLGGAAIGYFMNDYYENKFNSQYQDKLDKYKQIIEHRRKVQAYKAAKGEDFEFAVKVREIVPAQKLGNGEVRAPTVKEKLILLEDDMFLGE